MASLRLVILSLVAVLALAPSAGAIVDGRLDTTHDQVVFVGQILPNGAQGGSCTGTLVAPRLVVTAAHCGFLPDGTVPSGQLFLVAYGDNFRQALMTGSFVPGFFTPHPDFTHGGNGIPHAADNDLAVIQLLAPLPGPYAELPSPSLDLRPNTPLDLLGFGSVGLAPDGSPLPRDGFRRIGDAKVLGKGATAGRFLHFLGGACLGDSGGPLLLGNTIVAVVSFAPSPCHSTNYATDLRSASAQAFIRSFLP